jgi:proline dehydrogenase
MLRTIFIYFSKLGWAQRVVTNWKVAWRAASRFVAGTAISDAIRVVRELNLRGMNATLDHLGESTTTEEDAEKATSDILDLLEQINISNVRANISIKLTQIGLALNESLCLKNLEKVLFTAKKFNNFVRIDMEDTPFVDKTLSMYAYLRSNGYANTGVVLQSYLYRTSQDLQKLNAERAFVRLVKGAYKEPPELAFPKKSDVDLNFDALANLLIDSSKSNNCPELSQDGRIPPLVAIGSHDPQRLEFAFNYATQVKLAKNAIEFQMLYGIRRDLQDKYNQEGYPVRIYVPYGTHWYPFYMRRLAERPANLWFFISNFFRK